MADRPAIVPLPEFEVGLCPSVLNSCNLVPSHFWDLYDTPLSTAQSSKWFLLEALVHNLETSANLANNDKIMFSGYCAFSFSAYGLSFSDQQVYSPHRVLRK